MSDLSEATDPSPGGEPAEPGSGAGLDKGQEAGRERSPAVRLSAEGGAVEIVPMEREHLAAVLDIERRCFDDPWDEETFRSELRHSWSECRVLRRVEDGALLGYLVFWQVVDEVHLLNVAINPSVRHRHYGRMLLDYLLDYGRGRQARFVTVEVRESNEAAIRFYESAGLRRVGVRPRYDGAPGEDAVVMLYDLGQPAEGRGSSPGEDEDRDPGDAGEASG